MFHHCPTFVPAWSRWLLPVAALVVGGCETVTVPETDPTQPYLWVRLPEAERLGARYLGPPQEPLEGHSTIDPARHLSIRPSDPDDPIRLTIIAFDHESGIGSGRAVFRISFNCQTDSPGFPSLSHGDFSATYTRRFGRRAAVGTSTNAGASVEVTFTGRDLWRDGRDPRGRSCPQTVAGQGSLYRIKLTYDVIAFNNVGGTTTNRNDEVGIVLTNVFLWYPAR